jgi:hypothetical protein
VVEVLEVHLTVEAVEVQEVIELLMLYLALHQWHFLIILLMQ